MFHCLTNCASADGKLAELTEQLGKMVEHPKAKSTHQRFARTWTSLFRLRTKENIPQELGYRRPSIQRATDWQNQLSKSVKISKSQKTSNGGANGINSTGNGGGDVEVSDDGLAAAKVGLGAVLVLGGMYAARKLLRR